MLDDQIGPERRVVAGDRGLLDEVAVAHHPGQLDHVAKLHLPPLAARVRLAERGHERARLGAELLARLGERPQLRVELAARLAPVLVELRQLLVDPAELLLQRCDQLLDGVLALLKVALGLGVHGLQLRAVEL